MAFEDYTSTKPNKYVTIGGFTKTGEKNPESFEGYYLKTVTRPSNFDENKTETNYVFQTADGTVQVKGNTNLVIVMADAQRGFSEKTGQSPEGYLTKISYDGIEKRPGGRTLKLFRVQIDKTQKIDTNDTSELSLNDEEDTAVEDFDSKQTAAVASAARLSKLQRAKDLLKSSGK